LVLVFEIPEPDQSKSRPSGKHAFPILKQVILKPTALFDEVIDVLHYFWGGK